MYRAASLVYANGGAIDRHVTVRVEVGTAGRCKWHWRLLSSIVAARTPARPAAAVVLRPYPRKGAGSIALHWSGMPVAELKQATRPRAAAR